MQKSDRNVRRNKVILTRGNNRPAEASGSLLTAAVALCLLTFACCFSSCRPAPQYQEHYNIPGGAWSAAFQPEFKFEITDTATAYQLFLLIRHTDAYPFSNIWINMDSRGPSDSGFTKLRLEVPLAAASGQWLGRGMGELYEQRVRLTSYDRPAFFPHKGIYTIRLTQDMRRNPLPEVLTIGYRVEKLRPPADAAPKTAAVAPSSAKM